MLETGDKAPALTATTVDGEAIDLSAPGGKLVLFFYPKDNTPGCTKEAIGFSEQLDAFRDAGARIVGVSRDSAASHAKFTAKHGLTVPLISDESGAVSDAFGAWGEKSMYGRKFMGMHRSTFLIDEQGTVVRAWPKVRVKGHVEDVLEAVRGA